MAYDDKGATNLLVKAFDKKTKGYLKAFQRSFSLSSLDRSFTPDEEDPTSMTVSFLWSQLQSQRAQLRAEKLRADKLSKMVLELQHHVNDVLDPRAALGEVGFVGSDNILEVDKSRDRELDRFSCRADGSFDGVDTDKEANCDESAFCHKPVIQTLSRSSTIRTQKAILSPKHSSSRGANASSHASDRTRQCQPSISNYDHHSVHTADEHDKVVGNETKMVTHIYEEMQQHQVCNHAEDLSNIDITETGSDCHEGWSPDFAYSKEPCVPNTMHVIYPNIHTHKTLLESRTSMEDKQGIEGTIPEMCRIHINEHMPHFNRSVREHDTERTWNSPLKGGKIKKYVGYCSHHGTHPVHHKLDSVMCSCQHKMFNEGICNCTINMFTSNAAKTLNNNLRKNSFIFNNLSSMGTTETVLSPATLMPKRSASVQKGFVVESPTSRWNNQMNLKSIQD